MDADDYSSLLTEFRTLWAELGDSYFDLRWHNLDGHKCKVQGDPFRGDGAVTWISDSEQARPFDTNLRRIVGRLCMPLRDSSSKAGQVFTLGADVLTLPAGKECAKFRESFQELCVKAGTLLPVDLREQSVGFVGAFNASAAAWWYAVLFAMKGESVEYKHGNELRAHTEIAVDHPVRDSIYAIEKLGLNKAARPPDAGIDPKVPGGAGPTAVVADLGFQGGKDLRIALGVHPTQAHAFETKLARNRKIIGDSNWKEINNPDSNAPKYLYRADAVLRLAEPYKSPKSGSQM